MSIQKNRLRRVAIVGAGLSGTSFLSNLVGYLYRDSVKDVEIHVFEESGEFGPGIYKTSLPETCFLNHENNNMGCVAPGEQGAGPDHFSKYLEAHAERLAEEHECLNVPVLKDPRGYTPRFVYGQYLKEGFAKIEWLAKSAGICILKHPARVEKVQVLAEKASIEFVENNRLQILNEFDHVILTTGHCWNPPLLKNIADTDRFFHVYPIEPLMDRDIIAGKHVGIIGTGLSGIDATFTALKNGAEKVILTSQSAQLRALRGPTIKYYRKFFTRNAIDNIVKKHGYITLQQLIDLFLLEYTTAINTYRLYQQDPGQFKNDEWSCYVGQNFYVPDDCPDIHNLIFPEDPIARLKYDVKEIETCPENKGLVWRSIVVSMYEREDGLEFGDYVYQRLQNEDKVTFMKEIHRRYQNFTAAMPLPSAKRLLAFHEQGKLVVIKEFKSITCDNSGLLKIDANGSNPVYVDIGVDATGYSKNMSLDPLYSQLIRDGKAVAHPAGGILIDPNTYALIEQDNKASSVLMAVGPATIGSTFVLKPDSIGNAESSLHIAKQVYTALTKTDMAASSATAISN